MFFLKVFRNGEILSVRSMHFDILMKTNMNLMKLQAFGNNLTFNMLIRDVLKHY